MVNITYRVNGRAVSAQEWSRSIKSDLERVIHEGVTKKIVGMVSSMRCRVHGEAPRDIEVTRTNKSRYTAKATGCCDDFQKQIDEGRASQAEASTDENEGGHADDDEG